MPRAAGGDSAARVTLRAIAQAAKASLTTVSYAMRDSPEISAAERRRIQRRDPHLGVEQQRVAAPDRLREDQARAPAFAQFDRDIEHVVEPRGRAEIDPHRPHREHQTVVFAQEFLSVPQRAHPFAARALEEGQVLRVVDHAAGVGIFPVNADVVDEWLVHAGMRRVGGWSFVVGESKAWFRSTNHQPPTTNGITLLSFR